MKRSITHLIGTLVLMGTTIGSMAQNSSCKPWYDPNGLWQGKGRITISSDGNEHDKDDWSATDFSLAMLAAKGLQDQLVLYTFSDHIWGSDHVHSNAIQEMLISALEGKVQFGFDNTRFIESVTHPDSAKNATVAEINKSTASDPLFMIAAGPMEVFGEALNAADPSKLKYVTILSHSTWNDNHANNPSSWEHHSGWVWSAIQKNFQPKGLNMVHIIDQNGGNGYDGMRAAITKFSWIKTSPARNNPLYKTGSWDWLYSRQQAAQKGTEFDASDAGMIIYFLLGKQKTNPSDAQYIMENPVAKCGGNSTSSQPPAVSFISPAKNAAFPAGSDVDVQVNASDAGGTVTLVKLYVNNHLLARQLSSPPFEWGSPNNNRDARLRNMKPGTYHLKTVAYNHAGDSTVATTSFVIRAASQAPTVSFITPANNATFSAGSDVDVQVNASDAGGTVTLVKLYVNNHLLARQLTSSPYEWGSPTNNYDARLRNMKPGTYSLKTVAYNNTGDSSAATSNLIVSTITGTSHSTAVASPYVYFNSDKTILYIVGESTTTKWKLYSINGTILKKGQGTQVNFSDIQPGTYLITFNSVRLRIMK